MADMDQFTDKLSMILDNSWSAAALSGVAGAIVGGFIANYAQNKRADVLPSIKSGYDRVPAYEHNDSANYYASVNDFVMALTGAWNLSKRGCDGVNFSSSLGRSGINDLVGRINDSSDKLLSGLQKTFDIGKTAGNCESLLSKCWDYDSQDHYITVMVPVTTTVNGQTQTSMQPQTRYSHTTHDFTFHKGDYESARRSVESFLSENSVGDLYVSNIKRIDVPTVGLVDRDSIATILEGKSDIPDSETVKKYLNQWNESAKIRGDLSQGSGSLSALFDEGLSLLEVIDASESSYNYQTSGRSHSGPEGYRACNKLESYFGAISESTGSLSESILNTVKSANEISESLKQPLVAGKRGRKNIENWVAESINMYKLNFPDSKINVDQLSKNGITALVAGIVGLVAAGAVYVLHPDSGIISW